VLLAGIAFSGLQPPGSTFKMITTTGALEAGITNPQRTYPVQQKAVLEGVDLENANGEYCGGSLVVSFAKSCNSVFAPLGAQLGAKRLVAAAERYGFNAPPDIAGAAESTIPAAGEIGDDLAGRVLGHRAGPRAGDGAADGDGRGNHRPARAPPAPDARLRRRARPRGEHRARHQREGRAHDGAPHAGRRPRRHRHARRDPGRARGGQDRHRRAAHDQEVRARPGDARAAARGPANDPTDTDAWFAAYAPAGNGRPHVAVSVLLVGSGAGGDTAAPAARDVLLAGLKATG
jgi:cell division protein FtsI/penicillin-binding protein 2